MLFDDVLQCAIPTYFFHFQCFLYLFLLFLNESGLCKLIVCDGGDDIALCVL